MRCSPWLLSLVSLAAVACSDDPVAPPTGQDAAVAQQDAAGGQADAAAMGNPDAADLGPCVPLTGGNCPTDQVCYYDTQLMRSQCRIPIGPPLGQNEEACSLGSNDCAAGLHCLNPGNGAVCLKACDTNADCDGVMGSGTNGYFCQAFNLMNAPKFCLPRPATCDVYAQMCPMNGNCTIINNDNDLGCVPTGTVAPGGGCDNGPCAKGGQCLNLGMGPRCFSPCDMMHNCPIGQRCAMTNPPLPWGGICTR